MNAILNALGPVFLIVLTGALLGRLRFPGDDFWPLAERFTYTILFPALLVYKLAKAPFEQVSGLQIIWSVSLPLIMATLVLLLLSPWLVAGGAAFTSLFQGSIRFNTYVGLAAAEQLFGEEGLVIAAMVMAVMIPLINLLCVLVFALKTGEHSLSVGRVFQDVAKNPLILGCVVGILLNISGIGLPYWFDPFLSLISQPALPLGLLAVGAGLDLAMLGISSRPIILSGIIKLLIMPLLAWEIGTWIGLVGVERQVVVLFFSLPTAPSAYILARQLGGDAALMAAIITAQALLAMVTMPLIMGWLF
ncbi:MAG: AEC family transporter [Magnetococcales bacterium]|nr:AEC family transporter [Magnetococcales bacterium]